MQSTLRFQGDADAQRRTAVAAQVSVDADKQTATFAFSNELKPGDYKLDIAYSGKINTQANGLFALDYTNVDGQPARSLFTQFEASDARRFVPSWDEPDYKATFDLTARVPSKEMAVSNMPATGSKDVGNGLKAVTFQTTPVMSSYLLFFAAGDFDRITKASAGREFGIVIRAAMATRRAMRSTPRRRSCPGTTIISARPILLPKLDIVAGPGQSASSSTRWRTGARSSLRKAPAARSGDHQRSATSKRSSASTPTRWRTSGSATSSPWRGGTTCG